MDKIRHLEINQDERQYLTKIFNRWLLFSSDSMDEQPVIPSSMMKKNTKPDCLAEANPILIRITTDVEVAVACNCINEFILITGR